MVFDKIKGIIAEQLGVEEDAVKTETLSLIHICLIELQCHFYILRIDVPL